MIRKRCLPSIAALLAFTGCDPWFATQYRQGIVSYGYIGFATPPRSDRARWEGEAHEILESVRARCAPNAPSAITCRGVGGLGGQVGACSTRQ
jgi:hypothetical protein